jgi:transglutaminase-like putative cysteine protease
VSTLRVVHTTSFRYAGPVRASFNEARMTPLTEPGQRVLESSLEIEPVTWRHEHRDYWGTGVTVFEVSVAHRHLDITARARVEVDPASLPIVRADWGALRARDVIENLSEFLAVSPTTQVPDDVADLAADLARGREPYGAAEAICGALHDAVEYVPGVTAVHTVAAEAWAARKGVCQDIAHLSVGALRSIGIPARYVSGYLHPLEGGDVGRTVGGQSHAWVEWWAGQWHGFDPTNLSHVGEHHVVLGRGREYQDVAPLRGIFAGSGTEGLDVEVQITREA